MYEMRINPTIFKAYDVRGKYPQALNDSAAFSIAKKLPRILKGIIVVGHDTRLSSPALYKAVLKGIKHQASSIKIIKAGMMTTPMLYFLVDKLKAGGGIMVTA